MEQKILQLQEPRTTLMTLLDSLSRGHVIYIHAPAGFGKTVSTNLWLEYRESRTNIKRAFVSLDEYDDKTSAFCRRFVSAFANLQPENTALCELASHPAFNKAPIEFTLRTIGTFIEKQAEYILVLDDLHVIKNEEILNLLPAMLKRIPGNITVLLLSRAAPPNSFSEIAAKGELAVVDAGHLQFTGKEIKSFFKRNGKQISSHQADEILTSTGGWAIGIRTMLMSNDMLYNTELTDRHLENFLKTHVWEKWDNRLRNFMTLVSVVEELTPALCEWLIAGSKSLKKVSATEILAQLAHENAFLRVVGSGVYKFHDLFREFLAHTLQQQGVHMLNKQYNRAGEYFYDQKDYFRSVQYFLKSNNHDGIAESLYHMYDYNSPYASVEDTLNTVRASPLNKALLEKHPFLLEVLAWRAFVEGQADELEKVTDKYYKLLPKIILTSPRSAITQMLIRCMDYRVDFVNLIQTLRLVPFKGSVRAYTPSLSQNLPYFHRGGRDFSMLSYDTEKHLALFKKTIGTVIGEEYDVMEECIFAGIHYEQGNINKAYEHALAANAKIPNGCGAEIKFCAIIILTSSMLAGGQAEGVKMFDNIREMIEREKAFYLSPNFRAYQFTHKMRDGDSGAAREWLDLHGENPYNHPEFYKLYRYFTTARAYIVTGDDAMAILLLKKLLVLAERYKRPLDVIEAHILLSVAYRKKRMNTALEHLERALLVAHEYGYTQLFANEGAELAAMLHRMHKRVVNNKETGKVPADFIKSVYIAAVAGAKRFKGLTGGGVSENLQFTDKQKAVMHWMCEGYNRNEIAIKMGLTPNGVKSHTTLIYKKLNAPNNVEAVLKIKELGLLTANKIPLSKH